MSRFLPRIGSPAYHLLLSCVAILILGPLGGVGTALPLIIAVRWLALERRTIG